MTPRSDLPPMPERIAALPLDPVRGYPVPYFVAWFSAPGVPCHAGQGTPDFRVVDPAKYKHCVKARRCWVCGQPLGRKMVFVIGPMCAITGTTSEPPTHLDCALWSLQACPFLLRPNMTRRGGGNAELYQGNAPGIAIARNPGTMVLWVCRGYSLFPDQHGQALIRVGNPLSVEWWTQGRRATRAEAEAAIDSGWPALEEIAQIDGPEGLAELKAARARLGSLLPTVTVES